MDLVFYNNTFSYWSSQCLKIEQILINLSYDLLFLSAKEFGCTEFVNPKDHNKPIQQVQVVTLWL